jgi:hypothetical protein
MTDSKPVYTRLATSRLGLAGIGSLWLGPDHLLLVSNTFGVERYRRWFFKDIQAFIARRSARRLAWNLVVGGCGLLIAFGAAASIIGATSADRSLDKDALLVFSIILGGFAAMCLGFVLANTLLGPGCVVHVQTPFGVDKLTVPGRLSAFTRIADRLAPLIEAAQRGGEAGTPKLE